MTKGVLRDLLIPSPSHLSDLILLIILECLERETDGEKICMCVSVCPQTCTHTISMNGRERWGDEVRSSNTGTEHTQVEIISMFSATMAISTV